MTSAPIVETEIPDLLLSSLSPASSTLNLSDYFDDPFTTGLTARFELENTTLGSKNGITDVVLYDQADRGAPLSVQNFLSYVESERYVNSIIHRSVPGFIVQGGGFVAEGLADNLDQPSRAIAEILTDPPVLNEFSSARSNTRGTLSFAKLGGDPNSATSQWFFNLSNNAANLDGQNGGFTVFGEVVSAADLEAVDAIAAVPTFDGRTFFNQGAFSDLPLIVGNPQQPTVSNDQNFLRYRRITTFQQDELSFSVVSNSNSDLVEATVEGRNLTLDYQSGKPGVADITVEAKTLQGQAAGEEVLPSQTVTDTVRFRVENPIDDIKLSDFNNDENSDVLLRSSQTGAAQVASLNQTELAQIRTAGPTIRDQNWQIQGSGQFNDDGIADWVWRNQRTGQNLIWLMGSNEQLEATPLSAVALDPVTDLNFQIRATGDLNSDNQTDLIWFNEETSEAFVWYIRNAQIVEEATLELGAVGDKTLVGSGDFDGDGDFELLWQDTQMDELLLQELNGLTGAELVPLNSSADSEGIADGWSLGAIADYTVGGRSDIAWYREASGQIKIWEMNGNTVANVTTTVTNLE